EPNHGHRRAGRIPRLAPTQSLEPARVGHLLAPGHSGDYPDVLRHPADQPPILRSGQVKPARDESIDAHRAAPRLLGISPDSQQRRLTRAVRSEEDRSAWWDLPGEVS